MRAPVINILKSLYICIYICHYKYSSSNVTEFYVNLSDPTKTRVLRLYRVLLVYGSRRAYSIIVKCKQRTATTRFYFTFKQSGMHCVNCILLRTMSCYLLFCCTEYILYNTYSRENEEYFQVPTIKSNKVNARQSSKYIEKEVVLTFIYRIQPLWKAEYSVGSFSTVFSY